jgi:hypothetical protein
MRAILFCLSVAVALLLSGCAATPTTEQQIADYHATQAKFAKTCTDKGYRPGTQDYQLCIQIEAKNETTQDEQNEELTGDVLTAGAAAGVIGILSDARAKRDITFIRFDRGLPIYRFRYRNSPNVYEGVLAQDVLGVRPEAVRLGSDGYMRVNYQALGIEFRQVQP